jgi:hypothetical protein
MPRLVNISESYQILHMSRRALGVVTDAVSIGVVAGVVTSHEATSSAGIVWFAHIGLDRALG